MAAVDVDGSSGAVPFLATGNPMADKCVPMDMTNAACSDAAAGTASATMIRLFRYAVVAQVLLQVKRIN